MLSKKVVKYMNRKQMERKKNEMILNRVFFDKFDVEKIRMLLFERI